MKVPDLSQDEVERLAMALGRLLRGGETLLLLGPMGSGKTTFTRALAAGMQVDRPSRVCSPSYTLSMHHPGPVPLVHVDLFRLGEADMAPMGSAGFEALGLEHDQLAAGHAVLVVEWAQLWGTPPDERLEILLSRSSDRPDSRDLHASGFGEGCRQILEQWLRDAKKED